MVKDIKEDLKNLLERRNARFEHGTDEMKRLYQAGKFEAPCHWDCTGDVHHAVDDDVILFGRCPVMYQDGCMIVVREREAKINDLMRLGWPKRYVEESTWDQCSVEQELRAVPAKDGMMLRGPTGTGKTSAAALVAMMRWPTQRWSYVYWRELVQRLGDGGMPKVAQAPFLVIDDYGVGEIAPWKIGDVDAFWEYRNARKLQTMITTNLTPDQIKADAMATRWADRFRQMMPWVVTVSGESKR